MIFFFFPVMLEGDEKGRIGIAKGLLQHGANVDGHHPQRGWNSLHQASFQVTCKPVVSLLLYSEW